MGTYPDRSVAASSMSHILPPPTMEAITSTLHERILPDYNPTQPLDEDLPDDKDDDGDGHEAPNDDEDHDLPPSICPPPSWLMASFKANLQVMKDSVIGHGASIKITIYEHLRSFWLPRNDTFFILQQCDISPSLLYNPCFFYWDLLALVDQIRCYKPTCFGHLTRHGYWHRPCCIIDLEDAYWLMGVWYKCSCCAVTLQSWDARVLTKLPETLAGQFPTHLTHHSGMSDSVLILMRCCFQNGMGAKQFSDSLQVMHCHRYKMLEVKYLQIIESRAKASTSLHQMYQPFPSFDDKKDRGLNTIIPSAQWCHDMYDNFIETHEHEYHQHTAMLSGKVLAIDHSFKICKHIAKIAGETVFSGLLTITNEFGQIHVCDLVPTKAHFQPITRHGDLGTMELPSQVKVVVQKSTSQIEATVLLLIASMPENEESVLVVGLDSEWSLNDHIHLGYFPSQLVTFLKNPHILKVSQNVNLDLHNLQEESGVKQPFAGGVDVTHFAKCKGIVKNTWISLADLPDWHSDELSNEQLCYAALDAWASLKVYEELEQIQVPGEVVAFTPGQDIFLCQDDTNIIARGHISLHSDYKSFEGAIILTHRKQALSEFGQCPFNLVALCSHIRTYIPGFLELDAEEPMQSDLQPAVEEVAVLDTPNLGETNPDASLCDEEHREAEQEGRSFGCLIIEFCDLLTSADPERREDGGLDSDGVRKCEEILEELKKIPWPKERRSDDMDSKVPWASHHLCQNSP
ncbi:hypothetical protein IW262DRAFT_1448324 [Armillaria fumosa]|nr:hypothetical protein IW262DRAFT_1448324 [Armillaria fumosa]